MSAPGPGFPDLLRGLQDTLPLLYQTLISRAAALERIVLAEGETLFFSGQPVMALYAVVTGRLRATASDDGREVNLSGFGPGELVGELAVPNIGGVYSVSATAAEDSVLIKIPTATLEDVAAAMPDVIGELALEIRKRLMRDQLSYALPRLFGPVDETVLRFVESRMKTLRLLAGETLFAAGDEGRDIYFILGGRLRALGRDGEVLNEMTRGEIFGEIALLTGEPRTATIMAVRDSELACLSREAFDEIGERYPKAMLGIARIVVSRLRAKERPRPAARSAKCLAVLSPGGGTRSREFTARLIKALQQVGSTLHLTAEYLDALLNRPGIASADKEDPAGIRLTAWLDEQETRYQFLVFESDNTTSPWTRRCLRQADETLLVYAADSDPAPGDVEKALWGTATGISKARQTLILLYPDGNRVPSGTARWFAGRGVQRHFHIRLDRDSDFHRLARDLGGVAIGLALSGGGARGLAHIGIMRALEEAGIPFDIIGGTSMGAVISSLAALGKDWRQILEINRNWFRQKPHKEYTLPFISLLRSNRMDSIAKNTFNDTKIEDLWLPYFCISSNLTTSAMMVHKTGPVWKAVRASASLPGIFVPVVGDDNCILVDGGILNNLPGDIVRKLGCRTVIAVDVGTERDFRIEMPEFPSPWQLFWSKVLPFAKPIKVPNIADVLLQITVVSSSQKTNEVKRDADLCLRPPIEGYGMLQFEAIDEIADIGYRYAIEKLAELGSKGLDRTLPSSSH